MIVRNNGAGMVLMLLTFAARGELKDYIKGERTFDAFWEGFDVVAKKIVTTGFNPKSVTYPATFTFKDLTIRLDEPYTLNSVMGMHHGGTVFDYEVPLIDQKKNKTMIKTAKLMDGVVMETPLCLILSAQLKKAFAVERQRLSYDSWTMAGKLRSQQMIDSVDAELLNFKNHPAISFMFPETIFSLQNGKIIVSSLNDTPWLNGVTRRTKGDITPVNTALISDFLTKAVDMYKGIYGFTGTIDELRSQLLGYGVAVIIPEDWLEVSDVAVLNGEMTQEFRYYLETYPEQILATFPFYIRHTYGGLDLTGSELAAVMYDFTRVINKFTNKSVKYRAEDQFSSIYELVSVIMKGIGAPLSLIDISDFIIYHNMRLNAIRFDYKDGPTDLTVAEYNVIRNIMKYLASNSRQTNMGGTLSKTSEGYLQLTIGTRIFRFEVKVGDHIVNKNEIIDCLLSSRTLGYKAVEMLECIEGLYLACLDSTVKPGDLYNKVENKYRYTIPVAYLNNQVHPGFVVPDFNIYVPGV